MASSFILHPCFWPQQFVRRIGGTGTRGAQQGFGSEESFVGGSAQQKLRLPRFIVTGAYLFQAGSGSGADTLTVIGANSALRHALNCWKVSFFAHPCQQRKNVQRQVYISVRVFERDQQSVTLFGRQFTIFRRNKVQKPMQNSQQSVYRGTSQGGRCVLLKIP